jgi:hypothetical protein
MICLNQASPFCKILFDVSAIFSISSRQAFDLHPSKTTLIKSQKGLYYSGIKIFNNLPLNIRQLSCDTNRFNLYLKKFLPVGYFTPVMNTLLRSKVKLLSVINAIMH